MYISQHSFACCVFRQDSEDLRVPRLLCNLHRSLLGAARVACLRAFSTLVTHCGVSAAKSSYFSRLPVQATKKLGSLEATQAQGQGVSHRGKVDGELLEWLKNPDQRSSIIT